MVKNAERAAAIVGMLIVSVFLLGLAESIGKLPFWIICVSVLAMSWYGLYEECFRKNGD